MQWIVLLLLCCMATAIEPNFEDIEDAQEQPQNEVVSIEQDSPHSNAIHVAHNIPTGSDISITQKSPYNTTVHISLNIGKDCKVKVDMSDAVNSVLHVSLSNARMSEVEVTMNNAFNCSVHLSFQNPGSTSVKLMMDKPKMTQIHVSQNVPYNSPMEVEINDPIDNSIHCSQVLGLSYEWLQYFQSMFQSASQGSPMTVTINGDKVQETNQIEISQNAADDGSTLTCVPDCPQEEYVYDYQYAGGQEAPEPQRPKPVSPAQKPKASPQQRPKALPPPKPTTPTKTEDNYGSTNVDDAPPTLDYDLESNDYEADIPELPTDLDYDLDTRSGAINVKPEHECPGGNIETCIDVCPGFHKIAFGLCVAECGERCP